MAFVALPEKAHGDVFTEALWDQIKDDVNAGVMRPISDTVLAASAASITLASIPATHRHLQLKVTGRGTTAALSVTMTARFNTDSGANYDLQYVTTQATVAASESYAATGITLTGFPAASSPASRFGGCEIWVPNYAATDRQKTMLATSGRFQDNTAANFVHQDCAGFWRSTAAITTITLTPAAGSFDVGTRATLYGYGAL